MNKCGLPLALLLILITCPSAVAAEGRLRATDLRCEYRKNPVGIDTLQPRLQWKLETTDPQARAKRQTAYQILAASSEERLRRDQGDVLGQWEDQAPDSSVHVAYGGRALVSGMPVWWKVRVWDNQNEPSPWSEAAFWSVGLLQAGDWKGRWIGLDEGEGKAAQLRQAQWVWSSEGGSGTRYFRRTFKLPEHYVLSDALLYLITSGNSTLYINGNEVGKSAGLEDPISLDVTQALHTGANILAVAATASGDAPSGLISSLVMNVSGNGEPPAIAPWRESPVEVTGWNKAEFDDSAWRPAKVLGPYGMAPWGEAGWAERRVLPARMLRKDFNVTGPVKRATLYISGLGLSEAYLNGAKVGRDALVPALTEYDKRVFYLTYDVSERLKPGPNALGVILGNGRYFAPRRKVPTFMRTFGYPKLLLQLDIENSDGSIERVVSDSSWKLTTEGPIRANNEYDGEVYDARQEMEGWEPPRLPRRRAGAPCKLVAGPAGALAAQMTEPIRIAETLQPVAITEIRRGDYIFDMGQNMVGWCRLTVSGPGGHVCHFASCRSGCGRTARFTWTISAPRERRISTP